jgi:hypothetical protein
VNVLQLTVLKGEKMKKLLFVSLTILAAACSKDRSVEATVTAHDGNNGSNGHSIVSVYQEASSLECANSGSRLDMYLDTDDSLTASEGDVYLNSLVVCNGSNGLNGQDGLIGEQGPQGDIGPQGEAGSDGSPGLPGPTGPVGSQGPQGIQGPAGSSGATIVSYAASSCTLIAGTSDYVKASNTNFNIYSSSSCPNSDKIAEVSQGESYWVSSSALAVWSNGSLRVITFN